jgi:hypothetical protein
MPYKTKYLPKNPSKYVGDSNKIICRSLWERKFCKYLDENTSIIRWCSEELRVPYYCPVKKKPCMYYPDFLFESNENGEIKTYVVEVKPKKQTKPPENKKRKSFAFEMATYLINNSKWESAKKLCDDNGWHFKILTEEDLHIK